GVPYNYTITLTDDAPFVVTPLTKPGWMGITLSGTYSLVFSGTPTQSVLLDSVYVDLKNCNGNISSNYSSYIDVYSNLNSRLVNQRTQGGMMVLPLIIVNTATGSVASYQLANLPEGSSASFGITGSFHNVTEV